MPWTASPTLAQLVAMFCPRHPTLPDRLAARWDYFLLVTLALGDAVAFNILNYNINIFIIIISAPNRLTSTPVALLFTMSGQCCLPLHFRTARAQAKKSRDVAEAASVKCRRPPTRDAAVAAQLNSSLPAANTSSPSSRTFVSHFSPVSSI